MTPAAAAAVTSPTDEQHGQSALRHVVPGLAAAIAVAAAARLVHVVMPAAVAAPIGEVIIAVAIGFVVASTVGSPEAWRAGVRFCVTYVLRAAIILLGARLAVGQVLAIGGKALLLIVGLMLSALLVAHVLARLTRTPPIVASLVGIGVSVCGNTAIVATAPAIGATDDDVSTAVAVNTLFGMIAVFIYPVIGHALHLGDAVFGTWAGTAVNDTSQVVAVGFAYSAAAAEIATTVKLARNALMGVVIVGMSALHRSGERAAPRHLLRVSFPLFVVGFLVMAILNSVGVFAAASRAVGVDVVAWLTTAAQLLLLVALAGVGLATSAAGLRRTGWRPFVVGLGAAAVISSMSFIAISVVGPATG